MDARMIDATALRVRGHGKASSYLGGCPRIAIGSFLHLRSRRRSQHALIQRLIGSVFGIYGCCDFSQGRSCKQAPQG